MKTKFSIEDNVKSEKTINKKEKEPFSIQFLNKKRNKLDDEKTEDNIIFKNDIKNKIFLINKRNKLDIFLDTFKKIKNEMLFNKDNYFLKEKKPYFKNILNLKLINLIINYFENLKIILIDKNIFNLKDLIELIKVFLINEFQFSILTILMDEYILSFSNKLEKESFYYLGLYTKYISSSAFLKIFNEMLIINNPFKVWFMQYKSFLENINIDLKKINIRNKSFLPKSPKIEIINYNSMVENIIKLSNEKKEKNNKLIITKEKNTNNNLLKSNIGKKLNVIIVYKEEEEDYSEEIKNDSTNNGIEGLQTDLSL